MNPTFSPARIVFSTSNAVSMRSTGCDLSYANVRRAPHAFNDHLMNFDSAVNQKRKEKSK